MKWPNFRAQRSSKRPNLWSGRGHDDALVALDKEIDHVTWQLVEACKRGRNLEKIILTRQVLQLHGIQRAYVQHGNLGSNNQEQQAATVMPLVKAQLPISPKKTVYAVDVVSLRNWQAYLLSGKPEHMHAVTGINVQGVCALYRMIEIVPDLERVSSVVGNPDSVFEALMMLEQVGLKLHAICHSHRFNGVPQPSDTDWALQDRLDRGGYACIQGIVSEDGYWRFFAGKHPFEIRIIGKGVEKHDDKVFKTGENIDSRSAADGANAIG